MLNKSDEIRCEEKKNCTGIANSVFVPSSQVDVNLFDFSENNMQWTNSDAQNRNMRTHERQRWKWRDVLKYELLERWKTKTCESTNIL